MRILINLLLKSETVFANSSLHTDLFVVFVSLFLELEVSITLGLSACGLACLGGGFHASSGATGFGSIRIELLECGDVAQRVGLLGVDLVGFLGWVDDGLDFVGVDDTSEIGVEHGSDRDALARVSVHGLELLNSSLGPDAETSHVSTRGQLKKVQSVNTAEFNAWKIAEGLLETVIGGVDNEWSTTEGVATVTHLTLTGTDLLGVGSLVNITTGTDGDEDVLCLGSLLGGLNSVLNNERDLRDVINDVTTSHHKSRDGRGGKSRSNGITLLGGVDLTVPLTPSLGWCEHASSTAHVTEGSLSGSGSTRTSDTRNTGNGATGTPRGSDSHLTGMDVDGESLTVVLVHVSVNELNDVRTQRSSHDSREGGLPGFVAGKREDRYKRTGSHGENRKGII